MFITLDEIYEEFEDLAPRLYDVDQNGTQEAVVIESHATQGARLAIYAASGLMDATPYIGRRNRWLAPFAAADIDGDGKIEVAFIDRPHLAKVLRIWRYDDGEFFEVGNLEPLTNHRIGQDFIQGGVRDCGNGPELIMANGSWSDVTSVTVRNNEMFVTEIAPFTSPDSITAALNCS